MKKSKKTYRRTENADERYALMGLLAQRMEGSGLSESDCSSDRARLYTLCHRLDEHRVFVHYVALAGEHHDEAAYFAAREAARYLMGMLPAEWIVPAIGRLTDDERSFATHRGRLYETEQLVASRSDGKQADAGPVPTDAAARRLTKENERLRSENERFKQAAEQLKKAVEQLKKEFAAEVKRLQADHLRSATGNGIRQARLLESAAAPDIYLSKQQLMRIYLVRDAGLQRLYDEGLRVWIKSGCYYFLKSEVAAYEQAGRLVRRTPRLIND